MNFFGRLMLALRAFREEFVGTTQRRPEEFGSFEGRRVRYDVNWAMYESTVYRGIHSWAGTYKANYALYKYIRSIYNPSYRVGEFWKTHLWGGKIDFEAGNKGALPIVTDFDALRPYIAQVWWWSNWQSNKNVVSLKGAVLGDAIIKVVDDVEGGKVILQFVHPGTVSELVKDEAGNIKGYTIEESRKHPVNGTDVVFKEVASREGNLVIYETFLNNSPYDWNGVASKWSENYGFVPMVHIMHNDVGDDWGWSEFHASRSKMHEVDDLASMLSDQARKAINPKSLFSGVQKTGDGKLSFATTDPSSTRPEPGREEEKAIYSASEGTRWTPMVYPLDIAGVVGHIVEILKELERDYPELKFDNLRASGTVSGQALRTARQPAETKVNERRSNYDEALVRAHQMALTIGGLRGYFQGINLDSFDRGALAHSIGPRPVFFIDEMERLEEEQLFWTVAGQVQSAGGSLYGWLKLRGMSDEDIALLGINQTTQQEGRDVRRTERE